MTNSVLEMPNLAQPTKLASNIRELMRLRGGLTEAKVSRQTGTPQPTLHKILTGQTADPRLSTIKQLAEFFDLTLDQLMTGDIHNQQQQTNTHHIPLVDWAFPLKGNDAFAELTARNWDGWIVTDCNATNTFALRSKPSMEPRFPRGSLLVISPDITPKDGDLVLVHYANTGEATLRELLSDGPSQYLLSLVSSDDQDKLDESTQVLGVLVQSKFTYHSE